MVSKTEERSKGIKLILKASAEEAWLLYEFQFILNSGNKPNAVEK